MGERIIEPYHRILLHLIYRLRLAGGSRNGERKASVRVFVAVLIAAGVLAAGACGASDDAADEGGDETTAKTGSKNALFRLPEQGPIFQGNYGTEEFERGLSFRIEERGWEVFLPEQKDAFVIGTAPSSVGFLNVPRVFDQHKPGEAIQEPVPEDMVAWIERHPYLDASGPVETTVGGVSAQQIDVVAAKVPKDYPRICTGPCVPLFTWSEAQGDFWLGLDEKIRIVVLEDDVEGAALMILIDAPPDQFERFLPRAQRVLDTVKWKD